MLERISELNSTANAGHLAALRRSLKDGQSWLKELDRLIEDKVKGTIPEALCVELMGKYQAERAEKSQSIEENEQVLDSFRRGQQGRIRIHRYQANLFLSQGAIPRY